MKKMKLMRKQYSILQVSNEDKCKKLRQEYTRWNRQTNNSNEKIRGKLEKWLN